MFLSMENQEPRECLCCGFDSAAKSGLRSAVRHENYVFRFEDRVWGFSRQDLSQVNRSLLSFTGLLIGADNSRSGLRSGTSEAFAQGQRLQYRNPFIRFQGESAGFSYLTDHVNNSGASDLDDVARMNQWVVVRISRLKEIFQVHLHAIFGCRSIVVETRGHRFCFGGVLRPGGKLIRHSGRISGWVRLRG